MGGNSGQGQAQGQGRGETLPQEGDQVQRKWGPGHPQGTVSQTASTGDISIQTQRGNTVKKNADPENPALLITRQSGQDVVKRASEVEVVGQPEAGEAAKAKTAEGASGSGSVSRKRKEQASTPTKQGEKEKEKEKGGPVKRGRGRPPKNGNTAKKVRTGKEGDVIASDKEDEDDDDNDAEYDEEEEEEDENQDPEETEEEKDKTGKDADGDEGEGSSKKTAAADAENLFGSPVVPKRQAPHHGHSQSHSAIPPLNPNKTGANGNGNDKSRSQSASAGGGGSSIKKGGDQAGGGGGGGEEEPKRASIDALLNEDGEEDENIQQSKGHGHGHEHGNPPPRHAKQVADEKIAAVAAGKEAHPGAPLEVPGAAGAAAAADDGYNPEVEALLQAQ